MFSHNSAWENEAHTDVGTSVEHVVKTEPHHHYTYPVSANIEKKIMILEH